MAILDTLATFSGSISGAGVVTPQTVTGTNTTVLGSNVYDTTGGSPTGQSIDLGIGEDLSIVATIMTAFAGLTSLEMQLVSADDTALSTNLTVLASSGAIPLASLIASQKIIIDIPPANPRTVRRYVGVQYVIVGAGSAGALFTTMKPEDAPGVQTSYASGFSVL